MNSSIETAIHYTGTGLLALIPYTAFAVSFRLLNVLIAPLETMSALDILLLLVVANITLVCALASVGVAVLTILTAAVSVVDWFHSRHGRIGGRTQ